MAQKKKAARAKASPRPAVADQATASAASVPTSPATSFLALKALLPAIELRSITLMQCSSLREDVEQVVESELFDANAKARSEIQQPAEGEGTLDCLFD